MNNEVKAEAIANAIANADAHLNNAHVMLRKYFGYQFPDGEAAHEMHRAAIAKARGQA